MVNLKKSFTRWNLYGSKKMWWQKTSNWTGRPQKKSITVILLIERSIDGTEWEKIKYYFVAVGIVITWSIIIILISIHFSKQLPSSHQTDYDGRFENIFSYQGGKLCRQ